MTLTKARELRTGDTVLISLGRGWYQHGTFIALHKTVNFGKMTIDEVLASGIDEHKGKITWKAEVEYIDDRDKRVIGEFNIRRLTREL